MSRVVFGVVCEDYKGGKWVCFVEVYHLCDLFRGRGVRNKRGMEREKMACKDCSHSRPKLVSVCEGGIVLFWCWYSLFFSFFLTGDDLVGYAKGGLSY